MNARFAIDIERLARINEQVFIQARSRTFVKVGNGPLEINDLLAGYLKMPARSDARCEREILDSTTCGRVRETMDARHLYSLLLSIFNKRNHVS